MNDIMKIVQALEDLLKQLKMKQKNKRRFFKYVIRYFRGIFIRKFINRKVICKSWRRTIRVGYSSSIKKKALIPPHTFLK